MRQLFTIRFVAAIAAVVGLFFLLTTIFAAGDALTDDAPPTTVALHGVDLVEVLFSVSDPNVKIVAGVADRPVDLIIDGSRVVKVTAGTRGEIYCDQLDAIGTCAVVADLLGEGVVWFALVPRAGNDTVRFPAIDTIEDGVATLVNGWQMPHAPVLDRRCPDDEFTSYRELRAALGSDFTSLFDTTKRELVAVECRQQVDYLASQPADQPADTGP